MRRIVMGSMDSGYKTTVRAIKELPDALAFSFTPMPIEQDGLFQRDLRFVVIARKQGDGLSLDWSRTPDEPGEFKAELEKDVRRRLEVRKAWVNEVEKLVSQVEEWVRELDWSTRRIDKKIGDHLVGGYELPALLMQEGLSRILMEPIGRLSDNFETVDGVVDLYQLPAYDDIARLTFERGRWEIFHQYPEPSGELFRVGIPLSKESLEEVLDKLRSNAS